MSDEDFFQLCKKGSPQEVEAALKAGTDANARDMFDTTPLMWAAAKNSNLKVITALMMAAWTNPNPEVITTLVKAGVDVHVKDKLGSAIDYAKANQNPAVYERLLKEIE